MANYVELNAGSKIFKALQLIVYLYEVLTNFLYLLHLQADGV
jgi:hypothetical protein